MSDINNFSDRVDALLKDWETKGEQTTPSTGISSEEATQLGFLKEEPETQVQTEETQSQENELYNENGEREYQKLGFWDSQKDMLKAVGVEASHFVMPKQYEKQYESKTRYAETMKSLYRYGIGTAALLLPTGWAGLGVRGAMLASKIPQIAQIGKALTALNSPVQAGLKAARAGKDAKKAIQGAKIFKGATEGWLAGRIADFTLYRPEENEGHLADAFGDKLDGTFLEFLQTQEDDTEFEARLKNAVEGHLIDIPVGIGMEFALTPLIKKYFKGVHRSANAKTPEEAEEALGEVLDTQAKLDAKSQTMDLIEDVKSLKTQADETGEELDQLIIDNIPAEKQVDARAMGRIINEGEDIYPYDDGTFAIKVSKWDDAYKITPELYTKQLREQDPNGDLDISHMNEAVKHTWINRGWMGGDAELVTTKTKKIDGVLTEVKQGNLKLAKTIVNNYKDKWGIDNKITVEFIDNLQQKGKKYDGLTESSKHQGKTVKNNKIAIDKKKLQIQKLEDKLTMAEGGNKEVSDPVDVIKEELRIANNELKELEKVAKGANKLHNITIKIDPNAKDPYATLRAELEHARDEAFGETPSKAKVEGSGVHFARYKGDNEAEIASGYVHKKAQGKAKAVKNQQEAESYKAKVQQHEAEGFTYEEVAPDGFGDKRYNLNDANGNKLGYVEYTVDDTNVTIDYVVNETRNTDTPVSNVGERLVDRIIAENPDKPIIWDAISEEGIAFKESYLRKNPNLKQRIVGVNDTTLAQQDEITYNASKGGINEGNNRSDRQDLEGRGQENLSDDTREIQTNKTQQPNNGINRSLSTSGDSVNAGGENTSFSPTQLKLDFDSIEAQSTEDLVVGLSTGKLELNSVENIETILAKTIELDPEISGKTFKDVAEDSESYFNKQINEGTVEEAVAFIRGLTVQKAELIDQTVREQIACTKVVGMLKDSLDTADVSNYSNILTAMKNLQLYNKQLASAFGRALVYQKINKEALETFGEFGLSDSVKMGIYTITDILDRIGKETLGFTRMNPAQIKQKLFNDLEEFDALAYQDIIQDKNLVKVINESVDKVVRAKDPKALSQFNKDLLSFMTQYDVDKCSWYVKLCDDTKHAADVVTKYSRKATSYMINNVLGATSLTKNVVSGAVQGIAFPVSKIMGGVLTGNFDISKEGARTLQYGLVNFGEACRLAGRAFIVGEGLMTNTKEIMDGVIEKGFHEWKFDFSNLEDTKITIQNLHSFFPRCMMASDELMTQLNYRAMMRAKAATMADNELILGRITQAEWADKVDTLFKQIATDKDGKPLDFKAYAEAKDMLFQVPLDRKLYNPITGKKETVDTQSLMLKSGSYAQMSIEKIPPLRLFFPFIKTPVNIADSVIKSNPLYMALSPDFKAKLTSKDPMVKAKAVGLMAGNVMLYTAGIIAGTQGIITGTLPFDRKEKTALLRTGWQPYSIKVGDRYYSYQGLAPYDSILAACADYATLGGRIQDKNHEMAWDDVFTRLLATTINTTVDQAGFRTNTAKILDLFNPSLDIGRKQTVLASIAGGLLPASANVRDIQTILNGWQRPQIEAENMYQKIFKNYLPLFIEADYQRDVFGRRVDIHSYLATNATDEDFDTPEYQEMVKLAEYGWTPSEIKNVVAETNLPLTDFKNISNGRSAKDAFGEALYTVKIGGKTLRQAVAELSQDEYYKNLPVGNNTKGKDWSKVPYETQIKLMTSLFKEYADEAKNNVFDDSDNFVNSKGETMTEAKERLHYEMELEADSLMTLPKLY